MIRQKVVADMTDKKRMDEVGAYIEKYYVPDHDDIKQYILFLIE